MGRKPIDETGKRYGRLVVLRRATEEEYERKTGKPTRWLCQCDCGNTTFADGRDLRNKTRVSCGCQSREKAVELARELGKKRKPNLIGQRFGSLIVIGESNRPEDKQKKETIWECKCECGNTTFVRSNYLISGHTTSCGCSRLIYNGKGGSKGEQLIEKILKKENISYIREKNFADLKQGTYRYDFYLPELKIVLEYNGIQHYENVDFFYKSRADFTKAKERDRRKISYCLAHSIKMYIIPFWEIDQINSFKDILSPKFSVKSKFHNDEVWKLHQKNKDKN